MTLNQIDTIVSDALGSLADTVEIQGPVTTDLYTGYVVSGIADTAMQRDNLCWCVLGFLGGIFEIDLTIDSAIGQGAQAADNLSIILCRRLRVGQSLTPRQKTLHRDPLLHEMICHVLVLVHKRRPILPEWLGHVRSCRPPHLNANDSGLDLVALGSDGGEPLLAIGEAKAYENDPFSGLEKACRKFTQVCRGDYNDEIREAVKKCLDLDHRFTREDLASNIWVQIGRFGALVAHGQENLDISKPSSTTEVVSQDPARLFFITSPFESMRELFDELCERLAELAGSL